MPSEPPRGFRIVVALTSAGQPIESSRSRRSGHRPSTGRCRARRTICTIRAFIARARPSHHLCRASDETGPAPTSITRPARRRLEASPWWAPSRLPVVTRRLTDLASRGEQRVLSRARYCVGGLAATAFRISTAPKTSSQNVALMAVCPSIRDLLFADHRWIYETLGLFSDYRVRYLASSSTVAPAG